MQIKKLIINKIMQISKSDFIGWIILMLIIGWFLGVIHQAIALGNLF